ncbi:TetR/AcrR family transcriptional regulator [Actinoplanes sp. L3-i22]|uniref:TetR/AcrR family transcriptional regulator n=1 Tax=Actinoplanes sp. L3-i22 TaxID=2836373 RepID=UPI001C79785C|nr:TetR/AcrR family transcriptional regulator [Actinoplanes sp. L3-i22]BCY09220.1 TetR family transcriptional regulator [Actinoplanes sp. L3-i22]
MAFDTKPMRADARRNYEAILAAGKIVYARSGVDVPFEEVARQAGVGQGTLYRHFPAREHLFVAIMQERVDLLEAKARELLDAPDVWAALTTWLDLYDRSAAQYRGMSSRVGEALADDTSPVATACAPMKAGFAELFERARREGAVRLDVTATQLLTLIGALPKDQARGTSVQPYLALVLDGLHRV